MRQRDLRAELLGDKQSVVDVEDDADIELSQASVSESEPSSDSEDEDDTEALLLELEKIKKEREAERLRLDSAKLERSIHGNPLLDPDRASFTVKRRWDDDVVFKNQNKPKTTTKKRFVNDTLRSDFHRKFMDRYIK
jgi:protein CWC15